MLRVEGSGWARRVALVGLAALVVLGIRPWRAAGDGVSAPSTQPVPLDQAAGRMTTAPGYEARLVAGEPDVRQPIALTFDARGRLWVAECFSYPDWEMKGKPGRDRVLVLEDADGDGRFETRKVFIDTIANLSGIEVGFGGVWLCATPNLLFVPDRDGDDRPDGEPTVVLDGWDLQARHNVFNGLTWGPDGWLWGCNGILSNSRVGPPGTRDADRVGMNCGVWRYHPTRGTFEAVAHGTTNPWGLDFDALGEAFITNCVIPHLFHVIPGGHYQRMFGQDINPFSYDLLKSCADHVHWDTSERWLDIRTRGVTPTTDKAGGGHAHSGGAFFFGTREAASGRASILMGNIHGNRLNHDVLERSGSGYVARHAPDILLANDRWFRSVAQKEGPDGALYLADWSDTGECHESDADGAHRENGRIYRLGLAGKPSARATNLEALSAEQLVAVIGEGSEWAARKARRLLQERASRGVDLGSAPESLRRMLVEGVAPTRHLRALWTLWAIGAIDPPALLRLLDGDDEHARAWVVRLLVDDASRRLPPGGAARLEKLARSDPSPKVRLALASAARRLPSDERSRVVEGLRSRAVDAGDPNLPLMLWYAMEPLVPDDLPRAAEWVATTRIPLARRFIARRAVASDPVGGLAALTERLTRGTDMTSDTLRDGLEGIRDGLEGRRAMPAPAAWRPLAERARSSGSAETRALADRIALVFGDTDAASRLRETLRDARNPTHARLDALDALASARVGGIVPDLVACLDVALLRPAALRGLAGYDDPAIPAAILQRYAGFSLTDRDSAVQTLAARPAWALALLSAVGEGRIPRAEVSTNVARQLQAFGRKDIVEALGRNWGTIRAATADRAAALAAFRAKLTPEVVATANPGRGRVVFEKTCQQCHKLYGQGGDLGPELTGSNRDNLDYVLQNVLDPSASVSNDYRLTNVATKDGRIVAGILREQTPAAFVLQTTEGRVVLPRDEVEEVRPTALSMMPEGLLDRLTEPEVRDLIAYLASRAQVQRSETP